MNKISTLMGFIAMTLTAQAQTTEGFENTGGLTYYQSAGWQFYGTSWDNTSKMINSGSLFIIPTTSTTNSGNTQAQLNTAQIATPVYNFNSTATFQFSYKLTNKLANNAQRNIRVWLYDAATQTAGTTLLNFTIGDQTEANTIHTSPLITIPAGNGNKRLVFDFTGDGDGNTAMYFDNAITTAPLGNISLPVQLLNFSGAAQNGKARLNWQVASNEDGAHFVLEQSTDGRQFTNAAIIFATTKTGTEQYSTSTNMAAYFRLKIVNLNGAVSYSKTVRMQAAEVSSSTLRILQNPVIDVLMLQCSSGEAGVAALQVFNLAGARVLSTQVHMQKGLNNLAVNLTTNLSTGTYVAELVNGNSRQTVKFSTK